MPTRTSVARFTKMVEDGQFIEAMEKFYAPDATAQENNDPPRVGLPALLAHERKTLATFGRAHARCLDPAVIDGDRVVIHWLFEFHHPSGAVVRLDELAYQRWRGERIVAERFLYDPRQLRPG